jgi:RNA polymerase sigma-70 factor (ECF subfamily)
MADKRGQFEAQVMPHLDAAYRFARWLTSSTTDAEDLVQEAFLRAFRAFDTLRSADAKAWLFAIVRNCHATELRQQQRRTFVPLPEEEEGRASADVLALSVDPDGAPGGRDDRLTLEQLIADLAPEHREVLLLREVEDMSYREIADVTQVPIGTVMSRLARARAALKVQWREQAKGAPRAVR